MGSKKNWKWQNIEIRGELGAGSRDREDGVGSRDWGAGSKYGGREGFGLMIIQTITHKSSTHKAHTESINWRRARIAEAANPSQRTAGEKVPGVKSVRRT